MFINADGGLTSLGYMVSGAAIVLLLLCIFAVRRKDEALLGGKAGSKGIKQLTFCSMCIALAAVTSMIKVFEFTYGGSVTLCSMLFAMLPAWTISSGNTSPPFAVHKDIAALPQEDDSMNF